MATDLFRRATVLQPLNPGFWGNLGSALRDIGNPLEAAAAFRRASRLAPENAEFVIDLATALAAAKQTDEAKRILLDVVKQVPDHARAWFNLGKLAQDTTEPQQAIEAYQRSLQANPRYGDAHLNLGTVLQSQFQFEDAERSYRSALAGGAQRTLALTNLLSVLAAQGKFEAAEQLARETIVEFPHHAEFFGLLATTCLQQGRMEAALAPAARAAELDPSNISLRVSLGGIQFEAGHPDEGLAALKKIRDAHPDDPQLAYTVGIALLTAGDFENGWKNFAQREVRLTKVQTRPWLRTQLPADLHDHRVRLVREQGLGDELFFLRFVPLLKSLDIEVDYITNPKLESMLKRTGCFSRIIVEPAGNTPEAQVVPPDSSGKTVDILVGDLPYALHRDFGGMCRTLPAPLALSAMPEQIEAMRARLSRLGPPPYLALTWRAGTAPHEQKSKWWALHKNIVLQDFGETLAGLPHTLIAIQRKPLPDEIETLSKAAGAPIHDLCEVNDDLEDMLALLAVVDDYAGVSNTNMHLRAGLGGSARVLVPRPVEWRWMAYGEKSPWFPDFAVYRQGLNGTWQEALRQLRAHLLDASSAARH